MRVLFFGTSAFAVPSLEALVQARHTIARCVTQPDRPQGRGLAPEPSPVKRAALRLGLPFLQPERLSVVFFDGFRPDIGVVVAYGKLIRRELLELPAQGMWGVHPSLLPKYRGAAPVAWALLNGERTTGVTVFRLNEALDGGEIALQRSVPIEPQESAEQLTVRLAMLGAQELVRALELVASGRAELTPQQDSEASLAPKLTKVQGRIDWVQPAETIHRLIRAMVPWPGAYTDWHGQSLKIWSALVIASAPSLGRAKPGTVVGVAGDIVTVATGEGLLGLRELQPASRRRMSAKEFLAGHALSVGDRFGIGDNTAHA